MNEIPGFALDVRTADNRIVVNETSRPVGSFIYFTSEGDSTSSPSAVGGGDSVKLIHKIGDPTAQSMYVDLNITENRTFMHEGYMMWEGADFDTVSLECVPKVTTYSQGTDTYFNLYNGYLIVPAAGDGNILVNTEDMKLFGNIADPLLGTRPPAFWNATYDSESHQFTNITAAPNGDGSYNMFGAEVILNKFVSKALILKDGFMMLQTAESIELNDGIRLKLTINTAEPDHDWKLACILVFHRFRTT